MISHFKSLTTKLHWFKTKQDQMSTATLDSQISLKRLLFTQTEDSLPGFVVKTGKQKLEFKKTLQN